MTRGTPAAERTVALLNLLASDPGRPFNLSDIARALDISKGSAHALVTTLTDAAYLVRHPRDKHYLLGPAVVSIGRAAAATELRAVDYAFPAMRRISDELGLQCVASAAIGADIVILARTGAPVPLGLSVEPGQRVPLVPPLGTVFLAWSAPEEIDDWLRRLGASAAETDLARYRAAIATVRERGFSVGLEADARARLGRALADLDGDRDADRLRQRILALLDDLGHQEYILGELSAPAAYQINHVAAPIFDGRGDVVLALTLVGFTGQIHAGLVPRIGTRLVAETTLVSAALSEAGVAS